RRVPGRRPELSSVRAGPCEGGDEVLFGFVLTFFFFQAEDGIRDATVTGVQTCALPISARSGRATRSTGTSSSDWRSIPNARVSRSEERRVGKECRSRWRPRQ